MLHQRGYRGRDEDTGTLHGDVLGTHGLITFQDRTAQDAEDAFRDAVDDYLAFCAERGEVPDEPLGDEPLTETLVLQVPRALHRDLAARAKREGKSLSQFVTDRLAQSASSAG